ncbi:hypothetical protein CcCBS67573_g06779 [Chytriomyces confervae]|uniref:Fibronectin type-III domain-containing protein n=1 Tax=Chytriomyces confervae TaxID=246404 RepID=A0A507F2K0_9FUNG|nr:hypothetical protein CcCBS67573_g06779 [Chytriomyces confervae]
MVGQSEYTEVVSQEFTVGKVDAGMAILLSPDHHLIEFPSTILPDGVTTGSVINVTIERNLDEERRRKAEFENTQNDILTQYTRVPVAPVLSVAHVTQTSARVTWTPPVLYGATLVGLDVYRSGTLQAQHVGLAATQAKLSGLEMDHKYDVHIVARTSAGLLKSNTVSLTTHTLDNLTGICVSFGLLTDQAEARSLAQLITQMGATCTEHLSTDNTHLVCVYGRGPKWEKAKEWNIPCVSPEFLKACSSNGRVMPSHSFYVEASSDK